MRLHTALLLSLPFVLITSARADPLAVDMYLSPQCPAPADAVKVAFNGAYGFPRPQPLSVERVGNKVKVVAEATGSYFLGPGSVFIDLPPLAVGHYEVSLYLRMQTLAGDLGPEELNGKHTFDVVETPPPCEADRVRIEGDAFLTTPVGQRLSQGLRVTTTDAHGNAVAGVPLALHRLTNSNLDYPLYGGTQLATAVSDGDGKVTFDAPAADLAGPFQYLVNIQRVNPLVQHAYFIVYNAPAGSVRPTYPVVAYQTRYGSGRPEHFFMTGNPAEMDVLDRGHDWARSGAVFMALSPAAEATGARPVCRFYGLPSAGLDSHFFSASGEECVQVAERFAGSWLLETSNAFKVYLPSQTGVCPPNTVPLYRAFNNQVAANHWYGSIPLPNAGWTYEGYGGPGIPVAMCTPL